MFGSKEDKERDKQGATAAVVSEADRLEALPMIELAAEVMKAAFGPGGPGAGDDNTVTVGGTVTVSGAPLGRGLLLNQIAGAFDREGSDMTQSRRLQRLVAEGVQLLENAALVRPVVGGPAGGGANFSYALTRLGRRGLQHDAVEHILRGEPLESA